MARTSAAPSVIAATGLMGLAIACWWWQSRVVSAARVEIVAEPWDHVKASYPPLGEPAVPPRLSQEVAEAVVQANPFSLKRREVPPPAASHAAGGTGAAAPPPLFAYKGRINLGKRQRAIMEDTVGGKTYFLEVGQEVAGFKVLDIDENRVVLSDLATHEELEVTLSSADDR